MEEERYVVILWERNGYYLLKTAFPATKSGKIAELTRDWQRYSAFLGKTEAASLRKTASKAPFTRGE